MIETNKIYLSDCMEGLKLLPDECIDCCVTSPPYFGLRDYGNDLQIGLEETPELFVQKLVNVFIEVKRVLKKEGTLWFNMGDSYNGNGKASSGGGLGEFSKLQKGSMGSLQVTSATNIKGLKPKDLIGIPWLCAFALRSSGWYLRQDIIWAKPNPMPESVQDRCTKAHEYIFLLSKSMKYYYDQDAIKEVCLTNDNIRRDRDSSKLNNTPGRTKMMGLKLNNYNMANKRSVWTVTTKPLPDSHFATFPEDLISDCIKAGCPENGIVLDPFMGAGTTAVVASKLNRKYIGYEINPEYIKIAERRIYKAMGFFIVE